MERETGSSAGSTTSSAKGKHLIASLTENPLSKPARLRSLSVGSSSRFLFRCLLAALFMAGSASAYPAESSLIQKPDFKLDGRTAADLSAEWWKWAMSSTDEMNPVRDMSGAHCDSGQQGKVWFLAGGFGSALIRRSCTIPAGKYIFFPVINMVYWPEEENNGYTCQEAIKNAAVNNDTAIDLFVELDGKVVKNPKRFRARTIKCFDVYERIPAERKPYSAFPSASDGYWILLKPLKPGKHSIKFGGQYNHTTAAYGHNLQDIEYEINVEN